MQSAAWTILRFGLALTFIWIGFLIWQNPAAWGGYLQPWAADLLFLPLPAVMTGVAIFDLAVGVWLIVNRLVWLAAALAAVHLVGVLVVSGVNAITVRDIGLLAAALALAVNYWPAAAKLKSVDNS